MATKIHLGYPLYRGLTLHAGNVRMMEHKSTGSGQICVLFRGVYVY